MSALVAVSVIVSVVMGAALAALVAVQKERGKTLVLNSNALAE